MSKQQPQAPEPKRAADSLQLARSIYNRRKALHAKANQLLADAPAEVQTLVEAHEEQDARKVIDHLPSAPSVDIETE